MSNKNKEFVNELLRKTREEPIEKEIKTIHEKNIDGSEFIEGQDSNLIPVNKKELERIIAENQFLKNASDVSLASLLNQLDSDDESLGEALTHAVNVFLRRDRTKKQIQERLKQVKPVGGAADNQQQQQ